MTKSDKKPHLSVMLDEFLHFFEGKKIKVFFEATLGAGGHARALLEAHPEIENYIGCDQDPEAIEIAKKNLEPWKGKIQFVHSNFSELGKILDKGKVSHVDGFFLIWGFPLCN